MFRATSKKKIKKTVTRLRSDSDEEEEELKASTEIKSGKDGEGESSRIDKSKAKKSKKKKGLVVRSFDVGEGDDDVEALRGDKKSKNRKRKRGLGFGGTNLVVHDEDELETAQQNETEITSNVYGKEALEKLKQEQAYKAVVEDDGPRDANSSPSRKERKEEVQFGDYIPLNGKEPTIILTGDEALDFEENRNDPSDENRLDKQEHFKTVLDESNFLDDAENQQEAEETSAWEAEITRRAGIAGKQRDGQTRDTSHDVRSSANSTSAMSLAKLRQQIQSTISHLETQERDVDRACDRRRVELSQTKEELERQQKELAESGEALENYQRLREQLTFWTGALRDLKTKVQPILNALIDLDADVAACPQWRDWEDDMCAVLYQAGFLDRVLGRQPPDFTFEQTTTYLDEFGRDVKSQHAINREKRMRRRREIEAMRGFELEEDHSDAGVGEDDKDSFHERRAALGRALEVALEELEDEYTQLPQLALIFHDWQKSYPEDFKQCFANLSFGDLASVLVQVEVCKSRTMENGAQGWIPEPTTAHGRDIFPWMNKLSASETDDGNSKKQPSNDLVDRIVEKAYIPLLSGILAKGAYNILSKKQSLAISGFFGKLSQWNSRRPSPLFDSLKRQVYNYIKTNLDCVAIAMLNGQAAKYDTRTTDESKSSSDEELVSAVRGATDGQLRRLNKILLNVVGCWSPYLASEGGDDVIESLLDFVSSKYLFLLSSLRARGGNTSDSSFSRLWEALRETKWLEQPGRMLQAAPIRAAVTAFNLN